MSSAALTSTARWDSSLVASVLNDKDYRAYVIFIDGERENAIDFVRLVMEVVATGVRSKFRVIQKASILSWVKDNAKAKTKPKDPALLALTEACSQAQAMVDAGEEVSGDIMARLLKIKFLAHRDEVLEHRAAEAKAKEPESQEHPKTPVKPRAPVAAAVKKGKGEVDPGDLLGKKPTVMKKRGEEDVRSSTIDDEPVGGPDVYYFLHGFTSPSLMSGLAAIHAPVCAAIRFLAEEAELQPEAEIKHLWTDLQAVARLGRSGSPLRDVIWLDLPIGLGSGVIPDPPLIFDAIAALIYEGLQRTNAFNTHNEAMQLFSLPPVQVDQVDTTVYKKLADNIPFDCQSIPLLMHCMLEQVTATVDGVVPSLTVEPETPTQQLQSFLSSSLAPFSDGFALPQRSQDLSSAFAVLGMSDQFSLKTHFLAPSPLLNIRQAQENIINTSIPAQLATFPSQYASSEDEILAQKQEIYHFCRHTPRQVDQSLLQMKFEALLAENTGTDGDLWNLSNWSSYESLDRLSLIHHISNCLLDNRIPAAEFYPLENVLLLALYHPVPQGCSVKSTNDISMPTRLGLSNFIEHLSPINVRDVIKSKPGAHAVVLRPTTPSRTVAYDIGDVFFQLQAEQTQLFAQDGGILTSQLIHVAEQSPSCILTLQKARDQFTLHLASEEDESFCASSFVGTFSDGTSFAISKSTIDSLQRKDRPTRSAVVVEATPVSVILEQPIVAAKPKDKASKDAKEPKDGKEQKERPKSKRESVLPDPEQRHLISRPTTPKPPGLDVILSTSTGLSVQALSGGWFRQSYASSSECSHTSESYLMSPALTEHSRSIGPTGSVIRFLKNGEVETLTANGNRYVQINGEWVATLQNGDRLKVETFDVARLPAITSVFQTDVITGAKVTTNAEMTIFVERNDAFIVHYNDGTRITTKLNADRTTESVRVECLGFAPIEFSNQQATIFLSPVTRLSHDIAANSFNIQAPQGTQVSLNKDGSSTVSFTGAVSYAVNFFEGSIQTESEGQVLAMRAGKGVIEVVPEPTSSIQSQSSKQRIKNHIQAPIRTESANQGGISRGMSAFLANAHSANRKRGHSHRVQTGDAPDTATTPINVNARLFIIQPDGTGLELLRAEDVDREVELEKTATQAQLGSKVDIKVDPLNEDGSSSLLVLRNDAPENLSESAYQEASIIPLGLRRKKTCQAQHLRGAKETVSYRHFIRHVPFTADHRQQLLDDMMTYVDWKQKQLAHYEAMQNSDGPLESDQVHSLEFEAKFLELHSEPALTLEMAPIRVQEKLRASSSSLINNVPKPKKAVVSEPRKANDAYFVGSPLEGDLTSTKQQLREKQVPKYFQGELGQEYLRTLDLNALARKDPIAKPSSPQLEHLATPPKPIVHEVLSQPTPTTADPPPSSQAIPAEEAPSSAEKPDSTHAVTSAASAPAPAPAPADEPIKREHSASAPRSLRASAHAVTAIDIAGLPDAAPRMPTRTAPLPPIKTDKPKTPPQQASNLRISSTQIDFGVLKVGCSYVYSLKISNVGEAVRYRLKHSLTTGLQVTPISGPIFKGIDTKIDVTLTPSSPSPSLSETITILFDDGSSFNVTISAKVLSAIEFEAQPLSGTLRGRSIRLVDVK